MIDIGSKIRDLRKKNNLSISELSKISGLSMSMISQTERNIISPSISTLEILSKIFSVKMSYFFEEEKPSNIIFRKANSSSFVIEIMSNSLTGASVYFIKLKKGEKRNINIKSDINFSEYFYIINGTLSIKINKKDIVLNTGDSIYFREINPRNFFAINDLEVLCFRWKSI